MFALRTIHVPVSMGAESYVGKSGTARSSINEIGGQVQVESELWTAEPTAESEKISKGDKVEVVEIKGLRLKVRKIK
jgi:membrane-bound ClpP family serine protease